MTLLFQQRLFSWLDSYDVYDEEQNPVFTVKGVLAFKHCFIVYDADGREVGMIRERVLTFLCPRFDLVIDGVEAGSIDAATNWACHDCDSARIPEWLSDRGGYWT